MVEAKPTELPLPDPQADPVDEINPVADTWRQLVPLPPSDETKSCEVEAVPVTVRIDDVALVLKKFVLLAVVAKRVVEVALVEVTLPKRASAMLALVPKRLVDDAVVEKKLVDVPLPFTKKLPLIESLSFGVVDPIPNFPFVSRVRADIDDVANVDGDAVAI